MSQARGPDGAKVLGLGLKCFFESGLFQHAVRRVVIYFAVNYQAGIGQRAVPQLVVTFRLTFKAAARLSPYFLRQHPFELGCKVRHLLGVVDDAFSLEVDKLTL